MRAQAVGVQGGKLAQRLAAGPEVGVGALDKRGGCRVGLPLRLREDLVDQDGRRLGVALDLLAGCDASDELGEAARHALAARVVERERVAGDDLEVAHKRSVGADK